jgi:type IV secretion system protein VirB6
MEDFLGDLLDRVDQSGNGFSQRAYEVLGDQILPLLTVLFIAYVAFYGFQLIMGTARVSVAEIVGRVVRMLIILIFISQWGNFNSYVYEWLTSVPEDAGRAILRASETGVDEPTNGMSEIWNVASRAAAKFSEQTGFFTVLPALIGALIMGCAGVFIGIALAILILAKVMLWVLIGTAPIFIACMLFPVTRAYAQGWITQVLLYSIVPLFVYVIAAFLIFAMNPELEQIQGQTASGTLTLGDMGGFILLCLAGAFVLINVNSLAQGIVGGISAGIGDAGRVAARAVVTRGMSLTRGTAGAVGRMGAANRERLWSGAQQNARGAGAQAMRNRISSNSMPR